MSAGRTRLLKHRYGMLCESAVECEASPMDGEGTVAVQFARVRGGRMESALTILPERDSWAASGYSESELAKLDAFLDESADDVIRFACERGGRLDAEIEFEIEEEKLACFAELCWMLGTTPSARISQLIGDIAENGIPEWMKEELQCST